MTVISNMVLTLPATVFATENAWGGVDVKLRPSTPACRRADFVRVTPDDNTIRVLHMTHNEVLRGEIRLSGTMTGLLAAIINESIAGF